MDLTLVLLLTLPAFIIPAFFLPHNKIRYYTICSTISGVVIGLIGLLAVFVPDWNLESILGGFFLPVVSFFLKSPELTQKEVIHLSFFLLLAFSYGIIYFGTYLIMKPFYIGTNPDVHKPVNAFTRSIMNALFIVSTYGLLALFLIEIREVIPLRDGLLTIFFSWIHPIEA